MKSLIGKVVIVALMSLICAAPAGAQQGLDRPLLTHDQKHALDEMEKINKELDENPDGWLDKRRQDSERQRQEMILEAARQNAERQEKSDLFLNIRGGLLILVVVGFFFSLYKTIKRKREQKAQQGEK